MSEYQYYEFQAMDRPLTDEEQAAMRQLSSRVVLTPTSAAFTYNYGDFRGDPEKVLLQYFDAMFYIANWGSCQLMFRFPQKVLDLEQMRAYCRPPIVEEFVSLVERGSMLSSTSNGVRKRQSGVGSRGKAGCLDCWGCAMTSCMATIACYTWPGLRPSPWKRKCLRRSKSRRCRQDCASFRRDCGFLLNYLAWTSTW